MNRGFLRGPFLPLYGSGAIIMLLVSIPFKGHLLLMYLAGFVGATVLEYVTGVTMEALFKVKYWDYSSKRFNFQGHICLSSSIAWGFLTIFVTDFLHKPVERMVFSIPGQALTILTLALTALIWADFAISFKTAMDLRDVLYKLEKVKGEIVHMQKRLDVLIAMTEKDFNEIMEDYGERATRNKEELADLRSHYGRLLERHETLSRAKDWFQRNMVRSNPTMSSKYFKEAFEELKKNLMDRSVDGKE